MSLEDNKMLVDYSAEVAEKIPLAEKLAKEVMRFGPRFHGFNSCYLHSFFEFVFKPNNTLGPSSSDWKSDAARKELSYESRCRQSG